MQASLGPRPSEDWDERCRRRLENRRLDRFSTHEAVDWDERRTSLAAQLPSISDAHLRTRAGKEPAEPINPDRRVSRHRPPPRSLARSLATSSLPVSQSVSLPVSLSHTHARTHARTHTRTNAHTHACARTHTHAHTHTRTHAHTFYLSSLSGSPSADNSAFAKTLHRRIQECPQRFSAMLHIWVTEVANVCKQLSKRIADFFQETEM
jgi:hypothetical protein